MATSHPSLASRALLALLLFVGFYVLAIAIAGVLVYLPYAEWHFGGRLHLRLALFALVGAGIILWSLLPRFDKFVPPGPELTPQQHPRLFKLIGEVASATGQVMPNEVFVLPEMNAWVAQRGGIMGFASRRVMGLGLPLLSRLTVAQFAAVLAHEFGHYHGGDTALGPWIYRTRAAIGRTLTNLEAHSSVLSKPFEWYGTLFLRITHAISRAQEYGADALAAQLAGRDPLVQGLTVIHGSGAAFGGFWNQEYVPALRSGFRPPFREGFQQFISSQVVSQEVEKVVAAEMDAPQHDPYDTHPPLRDRIAALAGHRGEPRWRDGAPAISLIDQPELVEERLIDWLVGPDDAKQLKPVRWAEVPRLVWAPAWKRFAQEHAQRLKGVTPASLVQLPQSPTALAVALGFAAGPDVTTEAHVSTAAGVFGAALTTLLLAEEWELTADPGHPVVLRTGADVVRPFDLWSQILAGELSRQDWQALCDRTGIGGRDLGAQLHGQA